MRALLALALVVAPGVAAAQPAWAKLTPSEVLAKVDASYGTAKAVTASFTQTVVNATFGTTTVSTGTLAVQRPSKMRWDYASKNKKRTEGKSFVFDSKFLWEFDPKDKKVIKYNVAGGAVPAAIGFLSGGGSLVKEFTARTPADKGQLVPGASVIELVPKQPSAAYKQLLFVIDPTTWTVTRSVVVDAGGHTNTLEFSAVKLDAKHDAATFTATIPAGWKVETFGDPAPKKP